MAGVGKRFGPDFHIKSPGRTPLPKEVKEARKLNKAESFEIIQRFAWMKASQLKGMHKDNLSVYEVGILRSFIKFSETGDIKWIQFWIDHLVGQAPRVVDIGNKDGKPFETKDSGDLKQFTKDQLYLIIEKTQE